MPLGVPIPPSPDASQALLGRLRGARHRLAPRARSSRSLDPARKVAVFADGTRAALRPVPRRARPPGARRWSQASGMTRRRLDPGRPADARDVVPRRLRRRRRHQRRDAEGRRVRRGPGRGRRRRDHRPRPRRRRARPTYDGRGICYLEFGDDQVAKVDVTFRQRAEPPTASYEGPSTRWPPTRWSSAPSRIRRWFGRAWSLS